jgi:hypothetical protein
MFDTYWQIIVGILSTVMSFVPHPRIRKLKLSTLAMQALNHVSFAANILRLHHDSQSPGREDQVNPKLSPSPEL